MTRRNDQLHFLSNAVENLRGAMNDLVQFAATTIEATDIMEPHDDDKVPGHGPHFKCFETFRQAHEDVIQLSIYCEQYSKNCRSIRKDIMRDQVLSVEPVTVNWHAGDIGRRVATLRKANVEGHTSNKSHYKQLNSKMLGTIKGVIQSSRTCQVLFDELAPDLFEISFDDLVPIVADDETGEVLTDEHE